jgi:hypothetical protein
MLWLCCGPFVVKSQLSSLVDITEHWKLRVLIDVALPRDCAAAFGSACQWRRHAFLGRHVPDFLEVSLDCADVPGSKHFSVWPAARTSIYLRGQDQESAGRDFD